MVDTADDLRGDVHAAAGHHDRQRRAARRSSATWTPSFSDLQWVVDAYALTLAALLLTAGSLGDRLGRRRVFAGGFAIFTLASLLCGLAGDPSVLNSCAALQGVGGAAMFATTLALIAQEFQGARAGDGVRHLGRDGRRRRGDRPAGRRRADRRTSAGSGSSSSTSRSAIAAIALT